MRRIPMIVLSIACFVILMRPPGLAAQAPPNEPEQWSLRDGDRVALIGGTFIEREQRYGYLETALTIANPDKKIIFRNLGWSGDTIGGVSRSGFDPPEAGFKQLVDQVNAVKPTVIIVGYGANEAFAGKAGLDAFVKDYKRLIEALKSTKARFILLAPLKAEKLAPPLPDPAKHNQDIALYSQAIAGIAKRAGAGFVDFNPLLNEGSSTESVSLTDNGIHLTALGYWKLASDIEDDFHPQKTKFSLGRSTVFGSSETVRMSVKFSGGNLEWTTYNEGTPESLELKLQEGRLPIPLMPGGAPGEEKWARGTPSLMKVTGLPQGRYKLSLDGKPVTVATDREWSEGIPRPRGPEVDQVEELRQTILKKNELFFHRWRPQNITYLLGFRKYEQGNNAVEIPQFDPLVAEQEEKIAVLKKPVPHVYELTREGEKGAAK